MQDGAADGLRGKQLAGRVVSYRCGKGELVQRPLKVHGMSLQRDRRRAHMHCALQDRDASPFSHVCYVARGDEHL